MLKKAGLILEENKDVLPEFFAYRGVMPPNTLFKDIYQLSSGNSIYLDTAKELRITGRDLFDPFSQKARASSNQDVIKTVSNYLNDSIQPLMDQRDKVTVLLSGGLDSSILFKVSNDLGLNIRDTYSTGYSFEDPNYEKEYALSAADIFGTQHHYINIGDDEYRRELIETVWAAESPIPAMQSVLLHHIFKKGIPEPKNIILNGQVSEESLGWRAINYIVYSYRKKMKSKILDFININRKLLFPLYKIASHYSSFYNSINSGYDDPQNIIWSSWSNNEWILNHLGVTNYEIIKSRVEQLERFFDKSFYDLYTFYEVSRALILANSHWSQIAHSHGKTLYYPFSSPKLLHFAFNIPKEIKFKTPRYILENLARAIDIPDLIIERKKLGFNPITSVPEGFFDPFDKVIEDEFKRGRALKMFTEWGSGDFWTYWTILNYSIWKKLWINDVSRESLIEDLF
jgi:asparagine synthetase B (glutamine-hydrolysing)